MGREARWLLGLAILLVFAGWLLYSIPYWAEETSGGSFVEAYEARLSGQTLVENYTYYVSGAGHHYLYRYWRSPLYLAGRGPQGPRIELLGVECPRGSVAYIRDSGGKLYVQGDAGKPGPVEAVKGEAGCYFPRGLREGRYNVSYTFALYMPVRCGGGGCFAELSLADDHIPYESVHVAVEGVEQAALLAEDVKSSRGGGAWEAWGWSPGGTALKLYLLYKRPPPGAVVEETGSAEAEYGNALFWGPGLRGALKTLDLAVLLVPAAVLLAAYLKWGVEREHPVVPDYTYYVPDRRLKPWQVNLVFAGRPGSVGAEAVAATVIDLARRGVLRARVAGPVAFELPRGSVPGLDGFESLVLRLLRLFEGPPGVWSPGNISRMLGGKRGEAVRVMEEIAKGPHRGLARLYVEAPPGWVGGAGVALLVAASMPLFALWPPVYAPWIYTPFLALMGAGAGMLAVAAAPGDVMGRWRPGARREALLWWSFARTLRDLARLNVALPQDVAVWKEWLAYGTALGVGDRVVEAMRLRGISFPEAAAYGEIVAGTALVYSSMASSEGGGAGGGGGGGFGGGGAGVR